MEKLSIMKRVFILIFFLTGSIVTTLAQNNQQVGEVPVAKPVAKGIWVYLGKNIPKNFH
mgnify:CR=1 FL=1